MHTENLRALASDLNRVPPRSPYAFLGEDFPVVAARLVDKCRAELLGQSGSYRYDCPLDRMFFAACGLEAGPPQEFIATGADDNELAVWMKTHAAAIFPPTLPRTMNFSRLCLYALILKPSFTGLL